MCRCFLNVTLISWPDVMAHKEVLWPYSCHSHLQYFELNDVRIQRGEDTNSWAVTEQLLTPSSIWSNFTQQVEFLAAAVFILSYALQRYVIIFSSCRDICVIISGRNLKKVIFTFLNVGLIIIWMLLSCNSPIAVSRFSSINNEYRSGI